MQLIGLFIGKIFTVMLRDGLIFNGCMMMPWRVALMLIRNIATAFVFMGGMK